MSVIKDVKIKTGAETYDTRDIGAEAQNITISKNASGDIIEDITEPGIVVASTETLTHTLKGMQPELDFDITPTSGSENPVTSGGIYNAIQADSTLSPTSEKPVQNKVITAAITNKVDNTVFSDNIETINKVAVGSYSVGDTFMADNGKYYKAIDDIIENVDLILVGTNCEITTVSEMFSKISTDAENIKYDNIDSGLTATDVQGAIDEIDNKLDNMGADDVSYDNTSSGLSATDVQSAIDEIASGSSSDTPDVVVTGNGTKTIRTLLNEMFALIDMSKVTPRAFIVEKRAALDGIRVINSLLITTTYIRGEYTYITGGSNPAFYNHQFEIKSSSSNAQMGQVVGGSVNVTDESSQVVANGDRFELYYK